MDKAGDIFSLWDLRSPTGRNWETEYYNFDALNIPKDHPARAMQDTLLAENKQRG